MSRRRIEFLRLGERQKSAGVGKGWLVRSIKRTSSAAHDRLTGRFIPAKTSLRPQTSMPKSPRRTVSTSDLLYKTWPPFDSDNFTTDAAELLRNLPTPRARAYSEGDAQIWSGLSSSRPAVSATIDDSSSSNPISSSSSTLISSSSYSTSSLSSDLTATTLLPIGS